MKESAFPPSIRDDNTRRLIYSGEKRNPYYNDEGYSDSTAYYALRRIAREERRKKTAFDSRMRAARPRTLVARYD